jgi:hypothetical protein
MNARVRAVLRFAALELLVWVALYGLYLLVRGFSIASADAALANARAIAVAERAVGILVEAPLQDAFGPVHEVASAYYVLGFVPLVVGVLAWLAVGCRGMYRDLRSLLLVSIGLAVVIHVALPVAPPRLVPELDVMDTVGLDRDGSSFAGVPYNPYAAMPSMHVGWSLLVGLFAFRAAGSRPVRWVFAAHPALMTLAVTVTGNHFFLDSLAGAAVALATLALGPLRRKVSGKLDRRASGSPARPASAPGRPRARRRRRPRSYGPAAGAGRLAWRGTGGSCPAPARPPERARRRRPLPRRSRSRG